jgi:hypothetical protein
VRCILLVRAACLAGPDVATATVLTLSRDCTPYLLKEEGLSISFTTKHLSIQALGEAACSCTASAVSSLLQAQLVPSDACGVWVGWIPPFVSRLWAQNALPLAPGPWNTTAAALDLTSDTRTRRRKPLGAQH